MDLAQAREQAGQARVELIPAGVHLFVPGQGIQVVAFDGVHEPARHARGGNEVEPTARGEMPALPAGARDFRRDRRSPDRRSPLFIGLYGSLEEVNEYLRSPANEAKRSPRPQVHTRSIL